MESPRRQRARGRSRGDRPQCGLFAAVWASELAETAYVAMNNRQVTGHLTELTERLADAVLADEPDHPAVERAGADLVRLGFTGPGSLAVSLRVLGDELLDALGELAHPALQVRLNSVLATLAAGFMGEARKRLLHEQETVRQAAFDARDGAEAALRTSEARFRAMFTQAAIGIGITDSEGRMVEVNQSLADMLGYRPDEMRGLGSDAFRDPLDATAGARYLREMLAGDRDYYRMERKFRRKDGGLQWTHLTASLVRDANSDPQFVVAMLEDITERRNLQERLRHQATHDPLTGLPNRALFTEQLSDVFAGPPDSRFGLCYLDLDGFKVINDSLGHDVGDQLLVAVAHRLDQLAAGPDRLVARMGGDEFVVLVRDTDGLTDLTDLSARVLSKINEPVRIGGHQLSVSASIGIVERQVKGTGPAEVMRDADVTLYWAKADGKNMWACYDQDRSAREVARFALSARMPAALEREEFFVEYQPIVRLSDSSLVGVEALVRWNHPEFGRLGPDAFIGLAEETGLIVPLGRWVLREACGQARRWLDRFGARAPIMSVNLSARQTTEPTFVSDVSMILSAAGLPAGCVQLELTETAIMATTGAPPEVLRSLADMGIRIAIDDFGTGYSNLAYLRHLPVHVLKLAGSFMEGMRGEEVDPVDSQLVSTLVSLAHALGLHVTAEGVETAEQASRLLDIGCDLAQGWKFAKPGPPEQVDRLLAEG